MTQLSPLEEALFQSWARANGVENQNDPNNLFDHRGMYKAHNGMIHPPGMVNQMAESHNKANEPQEGGDTTFPDPYMAQAEMHGNMLKAQGDSAKLDHQFKLEQMKHGHKMELEQMKLQHKSQQAQVDRQVQAQQSQQARQDQLQDTMVQRQMDQQNAEKDRQAGIQGKVMDEHFARTRPAPPGGGPPSLGGSQPPSQSPAPGQTPQGPPQATAGGPPKPAPSPSPVHQAESSQGQPGSPLESQLMQRSLRG